MKKENLSEKIYRQITSQFFDGSLKPGDRLSEEAIVEQMGISRTPVREALRRLAQEGLITLYPRRFAEVTKFDSESLEKIGLIRIELLGLAARLAVREGSNSDFDYLEEISRRYDEAELHGTLKERITTDEEFYRSLAKIGGNEYLQALLDELAVKVRFIQFSRALEGKGAPASPSEHAEILKGLKERDLQALDSAIRRHLSNFYDIPLT